MSMALEQFYLMLSLTKPYTVTLSFTTGVGGCGCTVSWIEIQGAAPHGQLTNNYTSSASKALASMFFIIVHSTYIFCGGVIGFVDDFLR